MEKIFADLVSSLLPIEIYQHFALVSIAEHPHGIEIRLEEYAELLPPTLANKDNIVLDGYCNPLELLHFSMKGKPLYLRLYRRKWKVSGATAHYSNSYNFHPEGVKATHEFATFLKGEAGCTPDEYIRFLLGTES